MSHMQWHYNLKYVRNLYEYVHKNTYSNNNADYNGIC